MREHIIHLGNGQLEDDTPFPLVKRIVADAVQHNGDGGIVIHFHGGLVNENRGRAIAARLTPEYEAAGAFPIFFVWEAGLLEVLKNNLEIASGERLFRKALKIARKIVKRKSAKDPGDRASPALPDIDTTDDDAAIEDALDARDPKLLPPIEEEPADLLTADERRALEAELERDGELVVIASSISAGLRDQADIAADEATRSAKPVVASTGTIMDPIAVERLVDRPDPETRGLISTAKAVKAIVSIAARVIKRMVTRRAHGPYATIVEEILREFYLANVGGKIWAMMKKDTADSFGPDPTVFGGTAVLTELAAAVRNGATPKVTLVGHSTGAVYISHLIRAAAPIFPVGFKFDVVFLAPASTCALTAETIREYADRVGMFRMFTMTDENERRDKLLSVIYPHSLLYFVSGVVEPEADTPIVGMKRYFDTERYEPGEFPDIEVVRHFCLSDDKRVCWSIVSHGDGRNTSAVSHGDFDNDEPTVASLQHLLRKGF